MRFTTYMRLVVVLTSAVLLAACSDDDSDTTTASLSAPTMATFDVTVTNLTNGQPLSPVAIITHRSAYSVFTVGIPATEGLELMAEGGDNIMLLAEADAAMGVVATTSGMGPIPPGGNETVSFEVLESELPGLRVSVASMLVNTNDAFSNAITMIGNMAAGDNVSLQTVAYDAGTEANDELATAIPGPAGGGEGFNAERNDRADQVTMHTGVVSRDDGFATSDLTNQHRFDNPVMGVRVSRTQ